MSCLSKIHNIYPTLTVTEVKIADYIQDHLSTVIESSTQTLAKETETSPATWVRFAKKLGYAGISALKVDLSKDELKESMSWTAAIDENDSFEMMMNKSKNNLVRELEATLDILNYGLLKQAINQLAQSRRIYIFGVGGSGIPCMDLVHKLVRIDIEAVYYQESHLMFAQIAHMTPEDTLVLVSYSGRTEVIVSLAKAGQEAGVTVVSITQYNQSTPLAKLTDIPLCIPIEERTLRIGAIASRNSSLVVTDFLYLGLAKLNLDQTKEKLIKTREFVDEVS